MFCLLKPDKTTLKLVLEVVLEILDLPTEPIATTSANLADSLRSTVATHLKNKVTWEG